MNIHKYQLKEWTAGTRANWAIPMQRFFWWVSSNDHVLALFPPTKMRILWLIEWELTIDLIKTWPTKTMEIDEQYFFMKAFQAFWSVWFQPFLIITAILKNRSCGQVAWAPGASQRLRGAISAWSPSGWSGFWRIDAHGFFAKHGDDIVI